MSRSILDRWQLQIHKQEWHKLEMYCGACGASPEMSPWLANVLAYGDTLAGSVKLCDHCRRDYETRTDLAEKIMMQIKGMAIASYKRA